MIGTGYQEAELVANRSAVLLWGGSEADRRAWAEEAATAFPQEGPLHEVQNEAALSAALARAGGVVFVPNLGALGEEGQARILHCLIYHDERPKLVLGLATALPEAISRGLIRDDLCYRLSVCRLDLTTPGLKEAIRARRVAAAEAARASARAAASRPAPKARPAVASGKSVAKARAAKR